jgi:hypothetical protein
LVETILSKLRPLTRHRFEKYLGTTPLGLVGIFGFAGSGKTDTLAIVAHLFLSKYSRLGNDTFKGEAVDVVNSLRSVPFGWAFVTGGPGAGKTTAAVAIVKAITSHPVESVVQAQEDDATWKAIEDAAAVNENVETAAPEANAFALPEGDFTLPVYKLPTEDTGDDEAADANAQGTAWPGEASGNNTQLHVWADDAGNETALESWTVPPAGTEPGIVSVDLHTSIAPAQPSPLWHRHPSLSRRTTTLQFQVTASKIPQQLKLQMALLFLAAYWTIETTLRRPLPVATPGLPGLRPKTALSTTPPVAFSWPAPTRR